MFPALKQNLGGHKFKDDCEMETVGGMMADGTEPRLPSTGNRKAHFIIW
jgi:hypothetical protein